MSAEIPIRTILYLEDVQTIKQDDIDGVLWKRRLPGFVPVALGVPCSDDDLERRTVSSGGHLAEDIGNSLRDLGFDDDEAIQWIAQDADALASQFAKIVGTDELRVRTEIVRSDACRKFHRDAVRARMICTYIGVGTEYCLASEEPEQAAIHCAPTGSPLFLKGKAWGDDQTAVLLHRSPPIEDKGAPRLVVVIDEASVYD